MRRVLIILVLCFSVLRSIADEGMWLPLLLGQQVYNDMVKKGLKLSKEQLYSVNKASMKDAIILFSGFCTGEIVSNEGMIFTNHHCGYDAIASASSVQNNYLKNGFFAKSKQEEIPSPGLYAEFLLRIEDVTKEVETAVSGLSGTERMAAVQKAIAEINRSRSDTSKSINARVSSLFRGNQFLVFIYQRYNDVRLVGAPPESIGKYGGDTDNWEWPRHTGDFSIFRVYSGKTGQPAAYSTENIPLKPKHFLPISLKGVKEGDFAMIWGYPGSTNRYETSVGIRHKVEIDNPTLVKLREMRLKHMFEEMKKDPAVKLKLGASYASIANYWKFYDGESKQLIKYDVATAKKKQEDAFIAWAKGKPEFEKVFTDLPKAYDAWRPYSKHRMYINEGIMGSPLIAFAATLQQVENAIVKQGGSADISNAVNAADKARNEYLESANHPSDRNILGDVLYMFFNEVDKSQHPIGYFESIKGSYGDLKDPATFKKYAADVFAGTMILDDAKWKAFIAKPDAAALQADPAYRTASSFLKNYQSKYLPYFQTFNSTNAELARLYLKGIIQRDTVKAKMMYPDATMTMRVSYGQVKSYKPRDAVTYDYVTTMKGVLDKYKPGDYEFDLPERLVTLAKAKDYGQYIDKQRNDLVIGFITTNDITGGNSGSPVINANGELTGLCFDGNYEALSHKIAFDKDLNRTICVDVRYVLWCIDKLGNAPHLIKELKLVK